MAKKLKIHSKDRLVHDVIKKFDERSATGYAKYGSTLRDDNDTLYRWVNDVQEELMDAILYLQKVKETTRELVEEMYLEDIDENPISMYPGCCTRKKCSGDITIQEYHTTCTCNWDRSQ